MTRRASARKTQKGTILLLGAGRMGGALLAGWLASKHFSSIHVVEPTPSSVVRALARKSQIALSSEFDAADMFRVHAAVIAIKPQVLKSATGTLRQLGATDALVVSIAAGITTAFLRDVLGPAAPVVRAVPNTPGAIGRGITALYAPKGTSKARRALAQSLMAPLGETLWLADERLMDAVTALSGSGPAYVFLLAEALARAGVAQGLAPDVAARLARATVAGAGALLDADPRAPEDLRRDVTSPSGTTEAALKVLMDKHGLETLVKRAIEAATQRSVELGKP